MKKSNPTQTNTQEKKKENFFKKHWKKIVVTTVVVCGVTVSVILLYKNGDKITKLFEYKHSKFKTSSTISKEQQSQGEPTQFVVEENSIEIINKMVEKSVEVNPYVRRLPENRRVSPKKKIQMKELGIFLGDNYTYCDGYTRVIKVPAA